MIRRLMAGLRAQGYVQSEKGPGGGWTLACDLAKVTLRDIYAAVGSPALLAIGNRTVSPGCAVEQAVNAALGEAFEAADIETAPVRRFITRERQLTAVELSTGATVPCDVIFTHPPQRQVELVRALRPELDERAPPR